MNLPVVKSLLFLFSILLTTKLVSRENSKANKAGLKDKPQTSTEVLGMKLQSAKA